MTRLPLVLLMILALPAGAAAQSQGFARQKPEPVETPITLGQAIRLALLNNLQIEVSRAEPLISRERVGQAAGAFDPLGYAEQRFDDNEALLSSAFQSLFAGTNKLNQKSWNTDSGLQGLLPLGVTYGTTVNFRRLDSDSRSDPFRREFRPTSVSQITIPLLKDLIYNEPNVNLKRSRIGQESSDEEFRRSLLSDVFDIESSYWGLAAARANLKVAEKSTGTVRELLEQTRVQYEVGVVSRVNVSDAEAGLADRQFQEIVARNASGNAQDLLLNNIQAPNPDVFRATELVPEDPAYLEYSFDEDRALAKAFENRPELAQARYNIEDSQLQLDFARNQVLPSLDVSASYTMAGVSGNEKSGLTVTDPSDPNNEVPFVSPYPRGASAGFTQWTRVGGGHSWGVGARVEIPIGNRTARHRVVEREIGLRRARTQLRQVEQQVILEVRRAVRGLRSALDGIEAAERRRTAEQESLRAEQERLRLGDSTPFDVLQREEDLVDAQRQLILALQTYRVAIAALERDQGTLLKTRGINYEEQIEQY